MPSEILTPQRPAHSAWRDLLELLASMRFAIALLTLICIASIIGTVIKQNEPWVNYVNQFGPFWAEVFGRVGLYGVYSAWWFLLILGFLVLSTSLCIARSAPKILADRKAFKEHVRASALRAFHHRAEGRIDGTPEAALEHVNRLLTAGGWQAKAQIRPDGTMVAARKGMSHKLGYLAAHGAIVAICIGGLLDGDLVVRAQMWFQGKTLFTGGGTIADVPERHRLSERNPTYRGNLFVPEGRTGNTAVLNIGDGVLLQPLPFDVELKKFRVEYYETGMPKLFASDVVIHDRDTGEKTAATIKVNEPLIHRGIALFQSSFDDGGSTLKLRALPLRNAGAQPFAIDSTVGGRSELRNASGADADRLTLEFTGLRVINVENLDTAQAEAGSATDVRKVDLTASIDKHLGSGARTDKAKQLHNIGPSFSYKIRDAAGQAREYNAYMLPVELDGRRVLLAGVRETPAEPFRYLRIPIDDQGGIDGWYRMQAGLADTALREEAARRYARSASPPDKPEMVEQLRVTASRALALFSGAEKATRDGTAAPGGLQALAQFVETTVPAAEQQRVSEVLLRIVNGGLFELANLTRERAGLAPLVSDDATRSFMTQAVLSLSDAMFYPAPVLLQLSSFEQLQASVFQVARTPGKTLVYLGCVLLTLGVLVMLYIRERRLWIWLHPTADGHGTQVQAALSTTRRTLDADAEFDRLSADLLGTAPPPARPV